MERSGSKRYRQIGAWFCATLILSILGFAAGYAIAQPQTPAVQRAALTPAQRVAENCLPSVVGLQCLLNQRVISEGSGVILNPDGHILTNHHVVQSAEQIQVRLHDGTTLEGRMQGKDESTDLALIKVEAHGLTAIQPGRSDEVKLGESVVAIGSPGGLRLANSLTSGVVSGLGRRLKNERLPRVPLTIQHDAAINPGNSGGALFNAKGELIGINTLKYLGSAYEHAAYQGLGFAIPVDTALTIAQQLMAHGCVLRPQMGAKAAVAATSDSSGQPLARIWLAEITPGGAAEAAGLKEGDYILKVNGEPIWSLIELTAALDAHRANEQIELEVLRPEGARFHTFTAQLTLRMPEGFAEPG